MATDLQAFSIFDSAGNQILADASGFLQVNLSAQALGVITVAGTVTANQGTAGSAPWVTTDAGDVSFGFTGTTDPPKLLAIAGKTSGFLARPAFYAQIPLSATGDSITITPSQDSRDAFERLRVSEPVNLFDSQFTYDINPFLWVTSTSGGGTVVVTTAQASATLQVGTANGDVAILQSKRYHRYQPGKSQQILMSGIMGALKANVTQRLGYFDANNGLFFQQDGSNLSVVLRSNTSGSVVDTVVTQSNWNLDKLDGTGPSGLTLDTSKSQLYLIDFQWLGSGRIRWGVFFAGRPVYVHIAPAANSLSTGPYTQTANLPVRYELRNTAVSASSTTLLATCQSVNSEGGQEFPPGITFSANTGTTGKSVTTRVPVLSIAPKVTFNGVTNRGQIKLDVMDLLAGANAILWELVYNGTLTGASFSSVNSESITNFDTAATAISGGTVIDSGYVASGGGASRSSETEDLSARLSLSLDFAGTTPDTLTLVATSFGAATLVNVAITWAEAR